MPEPKPETKAHFVKRAKGAFNEMFILNDIQKADIEPDQAEWDAVAVLVGRLAARAYIRNHSDEGGFSR